MTKPKAILFDWDNTLVDTWPIIHNALNETLNYMGHPEWSLEKVRQNVKQSMRDSFPDMFGDRWEEAGEVYINAYRRSHLADLQPLDGAEALLSWLKDHNIFTAVVSNKRGITLREESTHLGWDEYFVHKIGSGDAAADKPDLAPATMALVGSEIAVGKEIWFIGDTAVDLECAANGGFTAVFYGNLADYDGAFPYDYQASNHTDLLALVQAALNGAS